MQGVLSSRRFSPTGALRLLSLTVHLGAHQFLCRFRDCRASSFSQELSERGDDVRSHKGDVLLAAALLETQRQGFDDKSSLLGARHTNPPDGLKCVARGYSLLIAHNCGEFGKVVQNPLFGIAVRKARQHLGSIRPFVTILVSEFADHLIPHFVRPLHRFSGELHQLHESLIRNVPVRGISGCEELINALVHVFSDLFSKGPTCTLINGVSEKGSVRVIEVQATLFHFFAVWTRLAEM